MDGTQLQVTGGLTALGAIEQIEAYNKIKEILWFIITRRINIIGLSKMAA